MPLKEKPARISAAELKRRTPTIDVVARDFYEIEFRNGIAQCPFPESHSHGDRNPSLRYDRRKNRVFCASQNCFGRNGVDAIGLVEHMERCSYHAAVEKLADYYGIQVSTNDRNSSPRGTPNSIAATTDGEKPAQPILAEKIRQGLVRRGFCAVAEFQYGSHLRTVRFDHLSELQDGKRRPAKQFRWEHCKDGIWCSGDGDLPKPLYVNRLFRERDQVGQAVGFEGEAKADLAGELGFAAFSFKGLTAEQASSLAECDVVLWPDNDPSGAKQAESAADIICQSRQARSVKVVAPPADLPVAGDIIDACKDLGWDRRQIEELLALAEPHIPERPDPGDRAEEEKPRLNFQVTDEGVLFLKEREDGTLEPAGLAARVDVVAETRDADGNNWGRLLTWHDNEGRHHQWAMPMELLAADAAAGRARLLGEGLSFISTNLRLRERFTEYLQRASAKRRVLCVSRIGWRDDTYVLPEECFQPDGAEEILYQSPHDSVHQWKTRGSAEDWRVQIGRLCAGNSRLIVAASCGFAGPLFSLIGAESGGIHFHGGSSTGKTTALIVGGSVCGGGSQNGFVQTWRTTMNGLEAVAEAHNDGTLFLDELAQMDPREVAETAYLLANGQGKSRMTRGMGARRKPVWNLLFVSAGELTLTEHALSAGKRTKAGVEVRLLNIQADARREMGMLEELHGFESPTLFVEQIREAALRNYGAPFRAFLRLLVGDRIGAESMVRSARKVLRETIPENAVGQVGRASDRFALIGAAGELATHWGLTGWGEGEALRASQRCFTDWLGSRGTAGNSDVRAGIRQVRAFLAAHGASRFPFIRGSSHHDDAGEAQLVRDRAGFRRRKVETGDTEYLIFLDTFRTEVCASYDFHEVARELDRRGFLLRQPPDMTIKTRLPEVGLTRVYGICAAILEDDDC